MPDESRCAKGEGVHVLGGDAIHKALLAQGGALRLCLRGRVDDGDSQKLKKAPALCIVLARYSHGALGVLLNIFLCPRLASERREGRWADEAWRELVEAC